MRGGTAAAVLINSCTATTPHSLAFDGLTGFVEAPDAQDLDFGGDWTAEAWFKDGDPNGFNHDYVTLLNKGDRATSGIERPSEDHDGFWPGRCLSPP